MGNKQFAKLNQKVVGILDFATNQIVNEMDKFLETQESLKLQAIIEPNNWRQLRADKHQDAHRMRSKLRSVSMTVDRVESPTEVSMSVSMTVMRTSKDHFCAPLVIREV